MEKLFESIIGLTRTGFSNGTSRKLENEKCQETSHRDFDYVKTTEKEINHASYKRKYGTNR